MSAGFSAYRKVMAVAHPPHLKTGAAHRCSGFFLGKTTTLLHQTSYIQLQTPAAFLLQH